VRHEFQIAGGIHGLSRIIVSHPGQITNAILESLGVVNRDGQVAAFILVGGIISHKGLEKGLLEFAGEPLVARTARLVDSSVTEGTVVGPRITKKCEGGQKRGDRPRHVCCKAFDDMNNVYLTLILIAKQYLS
jgi:hypothetical protein